MRRESRGNRDVEPIVTCNKPNHNEEIGKQRGEYKATKTDIFFGDCTLDMKHLKLLLFSSFLTKLARESWAQGQLKSGQP